MNRVLELRTADDGRVTRGHGRAGCSRPSACPSTPPACSRATRAAPRAWQLWPLALADASRGGWRVLSMGNPHAVQRVADVRRRRPWPSWARASSATPRFPQPRERRLPAGGFARARSRLRVFERGAGETLACGTGACAAVVAGIRLGWLDAAVDVRHARRAC
jgi:diaminopimelate epimerase